MVVRNGSMAAIAADTGISMGGVVIPGSRLIGPRKLVRSSGSVIGFVGDVANLTAVEARLRRRALGRFKDRAGLHDAWCRLHSDLKENHFLRPESSDDEDGFESTHVTALVASPKEIIDWGTSHDLCARMRERIGPTVILAFSNGKDAVGSWVHLKRHFEAN